jgi:hypothetical protein
MSTLAVFIALGGSSYAAVTLNGRNIKHRSIPGTKLKRNSVTGLEVRESRLGRVPRAAMADELGLEATQRLLVKCPADTFPSAGICVEETPRAAAPYGSAVLMCRDIGTPQGPGRRLPTENELEAALPRTKLADGGELTATVYPSAQFPGELDVLYLDGATGKVGLTVNRSEGAKPYRCVTQPIN